MMNKRADIPVVILVIGVVGICILTILSFVTVNNKIDKDFLGIGLIETANSIEEELEFYTASDFVTGDYEKDVFERGTDKSGKVVIEIDGNKIKKASYIKNGKTLVLIEYEK